LCRRNYLTVQSVERYIEQEGVEKPRILPYGPPVSDRDFELDYGNRRAETSTPTRPSSSLPLYWVLGWFLCGPIGALLGVFIGWCVGTFSEEKRSGE
jgi:hypothetical protein